MKKKVDFSIDQVAGQLTLEYGPFKQKLYQDGQPVKRSKGKYAVKTLTGETEELKILYGLDFVHVVSFRGRKTALEKRLSTLEYIIGGLPVLMIFAGGLLGAVIGFMGAVWTYDYFRSEKRTGVQLAVALGIALICCLVYLAIAIPLQWMMAGAK